MSDPTLPPLVVSPELWARTNPPQEVVASVAAVRTACSAWAPTKIVGQPLFSDEADLCDRLTGVTTPEATSFHTGLGVGICGTLLVIGAYTVIRDIYRGIRRYLAMRIARPPMGGTPS